MVSRNCIICGLNFFPNIRALDSQKYCSRKCYNRFNNLRAIKTGRKKEQRKRYREKYKEQINARDRAYYFRKYFGGLREDVLKRDNFTCQWCGTKEKVFPHHLDGNAQNNTIDNLKIICRACHCRIHHKNLYEKKCSMPNCGKKFYALGFCRSHYRKSKR